MSEKIVVPALGESVTEATVSRWLKNVGEKVNSDEPIVELETDKVNVEVPSPSNGVLENISVNEGDTVEVGALLGSIGLSAVKTSEKKEKKYKPPVKEEEEEETPRMFEEENGKKKKKEKRAPEKLVLKELKEELPLVLDEEVKTEDYSNEKIASPSARKIANEKNINLKDIKGTGKNGVILKEDLLSLMGSKPAPNKRKFTHGPEERIKMTRLRMTIAKRLKEAQNNAAMLTTFNEVDMFDVIQMKNDYKNEFKKKYSTKLGFMSFFVKACVSALKNFPAINAEIQDGTIV